MSESDYISLSKNMSPIKQEILLIQGCALLESGTATGLRQPQDILIVGDRIQAIGPEGSLLSDLSQADRIIEAKDRLALPGLINAHTHSPENLLKATSPSLPLELWLVPLFASFIEWSPRLVYLSSLLGAVEMLKTGTTTVLDHLWTVDGVSIPYLNAAMQAYADAGIRASVAPSIEDQDLLLSAGQKHGISFPHHPFVDRFEDWASIDQQMAELEQFIATWHLSSEGRLRCLVGPSGIHWCSPTLLNRCRDLAERYKTGMHLHAVETELQAAIIRESIGKGGISFLEEEGMLKPGTSLAHTIWLEEGDLDRLARTKTTVVHNPVSNLRLGSGRFPLIEALAMGVPVALGSDGSASNDTQNMFGVLKLTGLMHNISGCDHSWWPDPTRILNAATHGGASAVGMQSELGAIEPGQLADIVLINLTSSAFFPLRDPGLHLIYCEDGQSVETVLVNGKVVVDRGAVVGIDENLLRREITERCASAWPGFQNSLDRVPKTREVMAALEALQKIVLKKGGEA